MVREGLLWFLGGIKGAITHVAMPTTTYVAYQKPTSPPSRPVAGGYHGIMTRNRLAAMLNSTDISHARNSALGSPNLRRRYRTMYIPTAMKRKKIAAGYVCRSTTGYELACGSAISAGLDCYTEVECIAGGWGQNHEDCHGPFDEVWS